MMEARLMRTLAAVFQFAGLVAVIAATAVVSLVAAVIVAGVLLVALGVVIELRAR